MDIYTKRIFYMIYIIIIIDTDLHSCIFIKDGRRSLQGTSVISDSSGRREKAVGLISSVGVRGPS